MMILGILIGVCAMFFLLALDHRDKRPAERVEEPDEDFGEWSEWEWPDDEPHWRWRS